MAEKQLIPKSKAKNAYDLLTDVRLIILEEPQRYDQRNWKARPLVDTPLNPECGTVCCIAGWVDTLKARKPIPAGHNSRTGRVYESAKRILGFKSDKILHELFQPHPAALSGFVKGTPEYARAGSQHIAQFQQRHARRLKAKKV